MDTAANPAAPPQAPAPNATPTAATVPAHSGVDPERHAAALSQAQLAQHDAKAVAERLASAEAARAAAEARADGTVRTMRALARRAYLGDLRDKLYESLLPDVHLDDDGQIDEPSRKALDEFKVARPELFKAAAAPVAIVNGTTPVAGAPSTPAPGAWSADDMAQFREARVTPGKARSSESFKAIGWMFGHGARSNG